MSTNRFQVPAESPQSLVVYADPEFLEEDNGPSFQIDSDVVDAPLGTDVISDRLLHIVRGASEDDLTYVADHLPATIPVEDVAVTQERYGYQTPTDALSDQMDEYVAELLTQRGFPIR